MKLKLGIALPLDLSNWLPGLSPKNRRMTSSSTDLKMKIWVQKAEAEGSAFKVEVSKTADVDDLKNAICLKQTERNEDVGVDDIFSGASSGALAPEDLLSESACGSCPAAPFFFSRRGSMIILIPQPLSVSH